MDFKKELNLDIPIVQGGMGNIPTGRFAAVISENGGLGTVSCGTLKPFEVEEQLKLARSMTDRSLAINIPISVNEFAEEMIRLADKYRIDIVTLSAGNPQPYISLIKAFGLKINVIVGNVSQAKKVTGLDIDIITCEGYEAAGINASTEATTMTLVPQIKEVITKPLIVAGGIGDGRSILAAMALGADLVQLGTRLIATKEHPAHQNYKTKIVEAHEHSTKIYGKTVGHHRRVLGNDYTERLIHEESMGITLAEYKRNTDEEKHILGAIDGDMKNGFINGGQISGLIKGVPSVKELFESFRAEFNNGLSEMKTL